MPQIVWPKPRKSDRCFVTEAAEIIKTFAGQPKIGDKTKRLIERAARAVGLSYWQAFDLWYGKASAKAAELFVHRLTNNAANAAQGLAAAGARENTDDLTELAALKARIAILEARIAGGGQATPA